MTSAPSICQNVIFLGKKLINVRPKLSYLDIFWQELKKATVMRYFTSAPSRQIFPNTKFLPKIKILKFRTKIALIGYFGLEFQKVNAVFEISIIELVNMQNFIQKQKKKIKLVTKISTLESFKTFNQTYETFNQYPRIWETINFHPKRKKIDLGPKNFYLR